MTWWRSKGPADGPPRRWRRWLWTLLLLPGLGLAQPPAAEPEVRVIVDVSGSMRGNDPEQLAASAVELLAALLDRKSTRLNSSHVRISYAVFCLKKKTITYHNLLRMR